MRPLVVILTSALIGVPLGGCAETPVVERVPVAAPDREPRLEYARPKPLPDNARLYDRAEAAPVEPPK